MGKERIGWIEGKGRGEWKAVMVRWIEGKDRFRKHFYFWVISSSKLNRGTMTNSRGVAFAPEKVKGGKIGLESNPDLENKMDCGSITLVQSLKNCFTRESSRKEVCP